MKRNLKKLILFLLIFAIIISTYPAAAVTAEKRGHHKDREEGYDKWEEDYGDWEDFRYNQEDWADNSGDWNNYWQKWYEYWQEYMDEKGWTYYSEEVESYLVLVAQPNGTYLAYEDIAYLNSRNQLVVETKPVSKALGISYKQLAGNKKNRTVKYTTLKNFNINCMYYNTKKDAYYQFMGYRGVIIYSTISKVNALPSLSLVTNLEDNPWYQQGNNNNNNNSNSNNNITAVTVKPSTVYHGSFSEYKYTEATYQTQQSSTQLLFNLSEVYAAFATDGLPSSGVFGSGHCDTSLTLQGYNSTNTLVGELKTSPGEFLINFPNANQLKIIGEAKNLFLDFTPVMPIVLTNTTSLAFNQIGWIYPKDANARQYFLLADHMKLTPVGINCTYDYSRRKLNPLNTEDVNYAGTWQRVTVILKHFSYEAFPSNSYFLAEKTSTAPYINNTLVLFQSKGNAAVASDYPTKLVQMIGSVNAVGRDIYFPSSSFGRQLVIKLPDSTTPAYSNAYITLDPSSLDLDNYEDYYIHMHKMAHFYEASQPHYSFTAAWSEGIAASLAEKAINNLGISHTDAKGYDLLAKKFETDYSFLTEDNKNNFEAYYLNATDNNATIVGYQFTRFMQDFYGSDVVYRILQKVYAANIPTDKGRNSTYDKQFTDCIKAATNPDVFQLFIKYRVNKQY